MYWYRPILALHVIAIISWMAGILYLYRHLIYSSEHGCKPGETNELLKTMSRRLLKAITIPAMVVSWLAGISMVSLNPFLMSQTWFIVKFIGVLGITASTMHAADILSKWLHSLLCAATTAQIQIEPHDKFVNRVWKGAADAIYVKFDHDGFSNLAFTDLFIFKLHIFGLFS